MAAIIMLIQRKHQTPQTIQFFNVVDQYIKSQGLGLIETDDYPRTYFTERTVPPESIRHLVSTIKNTKDYQHSVNKIWYSSNLSQA